MPMPGDRLWKDKSIGPEERIDRFFNLIDHAVENGIPLSSLYSRVHIKEFVLYTLRWCNEPTTTRSLRTAKELHMPKLTLTSTFESSVIVGDPGIVTVTLPPKETKSIEVTEVQLRQLTPGLEKLKAVGWINYSVADAEEPATVIEKSPLNPTPVTPPPEEPKTVIVPESVPVTVPETPTAVLPLEPVTQVVEAPETPVPEKIEEEPAPTISKPVNFDKKSRR